MLEAALDVARREFGVAVDLDVPAGGCLALVGPSGAGKSTVLRAIAGLERPQHGRVRVNGAVWLDTEAAVDLAPSDRRCGYLFQEYALFPHLTALGNVAFGLRELDRPARRRRALDLLDRFGVANLAAARPAELSGGERQRVALARALGPAPDVLLLDEPLSALDAGTRNEASRRLAEVLADLGRPAVLVTHDFAEAALLAGEVAVMDRGAIVQRGSPATLSSTPASAFVAGFTGAVILSGAARPAPGGLTVVDLTGGGSVTSADVATGPVSVAVYPWEISLEPAGTAAETSAINHLDTTVTSVTVIGNRARVGLAAPQLLAAEVTAASVERLGLGPGVRVVASFKATATRLVPGRAG